MCQTFITSLRTCPRLKPVRNAKKVADTWSSALRVGVKTLHNTQCKVVVYY